MNVVLSNGGEWLSLHQHRSHRENRLMRASTVASHRGE